LASSTYSEEFTQCRVVWLAWLPLDVFLSDVQHIFPFVAFHGQIYQVLGEPEPQHLQHATEFIVGFSDTVDLESAHELTRMGHVADLAKVSGRSK
jgi:hypothetical protein